MMSSILTVMVTLLCGYIFSAKRVLRVERAFCEIRQIVASCSSAYAHTRMRFYGKCRVGDGINP